MSFKHRPRHFPDCHLLELVITSAAAAIATTTDITIDTAVIFRQHFGSAWVA